MGYKLRSSVLDEIEYLANGNLTITFVGGAQYIYYNVSADVMMEFMAAENHGKYYVENIRNSYRYIKVNRLPPNVFNMLDAKYNKHRGKSVWDVLVAARPKVLFDVRAQLAAERASPNYVKTQRQLDNERIAQQYRRKK